MSQPSLSADRPLPVLCRAVDQASELGSAEVLLETSRGAAAVYTARGAVAWIVAPTSLETLSDALERRGLAEKQTLRAVFRRCRETRSNFAEALVGAGIVDRGALRAALLDHNARQLRAIFDSDVISIRVIARYRTYSSDLVFSLNELLLSDFDSHSKAISVPVQNDFHPTTVSSQPDANTRTRKQYAMADIKQSLDEVMSIDGSIATALVDWESGLTLGTAGGGAFDIELAASGNTSVVKAKMGVMRQLGIKGAIEDILISLESQYHLIRPLAKHPSLFMYVAIDKSRGNLGLARHKLKSIEEALKI